MSAPKVAVITGADGGIGAALCRGFAAAGWRVAALSRRGTAVAGAELSFAADLEALGEDERLARTLADEVRAAFAGAAVTALVNNAATQTLGPTGELAWSDWRATWAVNVSAPFALTRAFLADLRAARGVVLNIGSVHAQATKPEFVAYATSKAALHGLTRALAVDLGPEVRAVCLAPAAVSTPMLMAGFEGRADAFGALEGVHPAGRIGAPEEVADAAVFLTSPQAGFATGATFYLDGGVLSRLHDPV